MTKLLVVAKYTFYEAVKSRLLVNVLFLGAAIILSSFIASELTYGNPEKVALDIGLGLTSIVLKVISVCYGVGIIQQEIENRSIYLVLSRPISRSEYFLGRIIGMSLLLLVNLLALGPFSIMSFSVLGGDIDSLMIWTLFFMYLESVMLLLVVVVLSLFCSKVVSILVSISIYIAGYVTESLLSSTTFAQEGLINSLLKLSQAVLPNFSRLNLKDLVLYETGLSTEYTLSTTVFSLVYMIGLVGIGSVLIGKKNLE